MWTARPSKPFYDLSFGEAMALSAGKIVYVKKPGGQIVGLRREPREYEKFASFEDWVKAGKPSNSGKLVEIENGQASG